MNRRSFALAAVLSPLVLRSAPVGAQSSSGPVRILVGFQPGASFDVLARLLAEPLGSAIARPVIVENRVGASGRIALEAVSSSRPTGEMVVVAPQGAMALFPHIYKDMRFDPAKDFTPITRLATYDFALTVGPGSSATSLAEYLARIKADPSRASFGSAGNGTSPHFLGVAFHQRVGVPAVHVPYKGSAPALMDVVSGQIPAMFSTVADTIEQHRAGKARIVATAGLVRSPLLPDVPTFKEMGIDMTLPGWIGFYGPAGMPADTVERYNAAVAQALGNPANAARLAQMGMTAAPSTPAELARLQRDELAMWGPVVKSSGFTPTD